MAAEWGGVEATVKAEEGGGLDLGIWVTRLAVLRGSCGETREAIVCGLGLYWSPVGPKLSPEETCSKKRRRKLFPGGMP